LAPGIEVSFGQNRENLSQRRKKQKQTNKTKKKKKKKKTQKAKNKVQYKPSYGVWASSSEILTKNTKVTLGGGKDVTL
jgi:hypothetical protein